MQATVEEEVLEQELVAVEEEIGLSKKLILWNDDFNTFEHVIGCLVRYIKKTYDEAEGIAWIVHTRGKYILLEGQRKNLVEYYNILKLKGLTVSID
ncbi:ATP-dependent Clp protease adaptor ClpS [Solitalea koreensis]|uniref:ATP-dependent Clp protease adaptor protein ClpS n=1 Tax=Solitalea koreensis TaxID=543615 RepID=A0A521EFD7_9SPHI|nr:ATP-dependent Clp protease adaptor ClpS [Solitalea koreensis]SMO82572.1 ATP-dependent Clp protease adaptor protein ClpS [Solitalea koreensis]